MATAGAARRNAPQRDGEAAQAARRRGGEAARRQVARRRGRRWSQRRTPALLAARVAAARGLWAAMAIAWTQGRRGDMRRPGLERRQRASSERRDGGRASGGGRRGRRGNSRKAVATSRPEPAQNPRPEAAMREACSRRLSSCKGRARGERERERDARTSRRLPHGVCQELVCHTRTATRACVDEASCAEAKLASDVGARERS